MSAKRRRSGEKRTVPADLTPDFRAELGASKIGSRLIVQPETETEWLMMEIPGGPAFTRPEGEHDAMTEAIVDSLHEWLIEEVGDSADQIMEAMMLVLGEGYTVRAAAEYMEISKSWVHSQVQTGIRIIRERSQREGQAQEEAEAES